MTELDHILDVHRREARRGDAIMEPIAIAVCLIAWALYEALS